MNIKTTTSETTLTGQVNPGLWYLYIRVIDTVDACSLRSNNVCNGLTNKMKCNAFNVL